MAGRNNISILDCTLRDGGLGLEDAFSKNFSNLSYDYNSIQSVITNLNKSNIEIIELGSIEISDNDKTRFAIYQNIEDISKQIPKNKNKYTKYAALYRGPDIPITDIPDWNPELCEIIRVIIRYSELKKSIDFCASLSKKGYKVCVQPMLTMRYTEKELNYIIEEANKMNAYALYFVDSYGYMEEADIKRFFKLYDKKLNKGIKIGFHAHNNMNLAFSNIKAFINMSKKRSIIIDGCIYGLGQGAGNMQTEIISDFLNKHYDKNYDYISILDTADIIEKFFNQNICGYSITYLIPAINKTAYKYSVDLRNKYKFKYSTIYKILSSISENLRHRYTPDNLEILLKTYKEGLN